MSDLIAGQFKGRGHDHAAAGFLPLWHDALLARGTERTAGLHLHRKRAKLVDGEESLVRAKFRQDRADMIELFSVVRVGRCEHDSRLAPAITGRLGDLADDLGGRQVVLSPVSPALDRA